MVMKERLGLIKKTLFVGSGEQNRIYSGGNGISDRRGKV